MHTFKLNLSDGTFINVQGDDIVDACNNARANVPDLHEILESYEDQEGKLTIIAGQAPCGCVYHAEQHLGCPHDLALVGLSLD